MHPIVRAAGQAVINAAWRMGAVRPSVYVTQGGRQLKAAEDNRLTESWARTPAPIDYMIKGVLRRIRGRSRYMAFDSGHLKRFIQVVESNTLIGPKGMLLRCIATNKSGHPRKKAAKAVEAAWFKWTKFKGCDFLGQVNFFGLLKLIIRSLVVDGEAFVEKRVGLPTPENPVGVCFHLIDAELVDVTKNEHRADGSSIRMGVEYNAEGRVVAYHLLAESNLHPYQTVGFTSTRKHRVVPAESMMHLFIRYGAGQSRGVPWAHAVMYKSHQQDEYTTSAVIAARIGAMAMGIIRTMMGGGMKTTKKGPNDQPQIQAQPGMFLRLKQGEEFSEFKPTYPHNQFEQFSRRIMLDISTGLGVMYHTLTGDLKGVNFSSMRGGTIEERQAWMMLQQVVAEGIQELYEFWLTFALVRQQVVVDRKPLQVTEWDSLREAEWIGRRWEWVDPRADAEASEKKLALIQTSPSVLAAEAGVDFETMLITRKRDRELIEKYGDVVPLVMREGNSETSEPEPDPPEPDDDEGKPEDESNESEEVLDDAA